MASTCYNINLRPAVIFKNFLPLTIIVCVDELAEEIEVAINFFELKINYYIILIIVLGESWRYIATSKCRSRKKRHCYQGNYYLN